MYIYKNSSARFYKKTEKTLSKNKNNKIILKKAHERYQDPSEEEINKRQQYGRKQYGNLPEDKKLAGCV